MAVTDLGILKNEKARRYDFFRQQISFSPVSTFGGTGAKSATSIAVDPNNSMHGFATVGGYIYDTKATVIETNDGFNTFTNYENLESIIESSDSNKSLSFVKIQSDKR
ncbi:MAG: hypothetical protein L6V93_01965 [Clostridiales bacterium]|nr:MAG: hypothetical protein L6V93_01965 [Clostridiales bacterium]